MLNDGNLMRILAFWAFVHSLPCRYRLIEEGLSRDPPFPSIHLLSPQWCNLSQALTWDLLFTVSHLEWEWSQIACLVDRDLTQIPQVPCWGGRSLTLHSLWVLGAVSGVSLLRHEGRDFLAWDFLVSLSRHPTVSFLDILLLTFSQCYFFPSCTHP